MISVFQWLMSCIRFKSLTVVAKKIDIVEYRRTFERKYRIGSRTISIGYHHFQSIESWKKFR